MRTDHVVFIVMGSQYGWLIAELYQVWHTGDGGGDGGGGERPMHHEQRLQ